MSGSDSNKDSITEVAEESFVRERPLEIERGAVLAGRYQVEEVIGKGGSGVVLRVFDRTVQNVVALKVLKSELARDAKWDKRFSRELRLGRPIQHPNVCRIFDIGEADGHRFLTMELATGGSLRDELKGKPALERPIEDRLRDARAAIGGLAAIHAAGVVHRDFKPDNLLRMEDGRLVISDFGLATDAAAAPGVTVMIGTPHYMAPEVLAGEPATARSDVWALGVVLHEIMFGRRPERKSVSFSGTERIVTPPRGRERAILALLERCLEEDPLNRPSDAGAVAREFEAAVAGRSPARSLRPATLAILLLAATGAAVYPWVHRRLQRSRQTSVTTSPWRTVAPTGAPVDWTGIARKVTEVPGRIHCFVPLDSHTVRIVWGTPRVAEDIVWPGGQRSRSPIAADTFRNGCPDVAPDGRRLLFTGLTEAGASEVRLSASPEGAHSTVVTSGSNPLWINNEEFVYDIDLTHVALFTLASRELALLPEPSDLTGYAIGDKAVVAGSTKVAVLYTSFANRAAAVFDSRMLTLDVIFGAPGGASIQFGGGTDKLLVSYQLSPSLSGLATVDWKKREVQDWGGYAKFDITFARMLESTESIVARKISSDAWADAGSGPHRLTADGQTASVAALRSGELLLSRRDESGRVNIWLAIPGRPQRQMTFGEADVAPAFSPDGAHWAYADYARRAVMLCDGLSSGSCRPIYVDEALPTGPAFSPDGRALSLMTQLRTPQVSLVSLSEGKVSSSWDSVRQCPPVWSSDGTIWTLESENGRLRWAEHLRTGRTTGRAVRTASAVLSQKECWPSGVIGPSALIRAWTVTEESSSLLDLPVKRGQLGTLR